MRARTSAQPGFDYQIARTNDQWPEHVLRTNVTAGIIAWLKPRTVLDPACGDGSIALLAHQIRPIEMAALSDLSGPSIEAVRVKLLEGDPWLDSWTADTLPIDFMLREWKDQPFDVVVLTEVLEHLEDPVATLKLARKAGRNLVASSPEMRPGQIDSNPEHLWQFDGDGYLQMLAEAGYQTIGTKVHLHFESQYDFQIWVAQ